MRIEYLSQNGYADVCMYIRVRTHVCKYMYVCMYVCMYMCVCMHVCMYVWIEPVPTVRL